MIAIVGDFGPMAGFAALRARHAAGALPGARCLDWRGELDLAGVDALVAVGNHGPARAALRAVGERPLWLDVAGDPFAEAQAAAHGGHGAAAGDEAVAIYAAALARADAISVVSTPQRHAALGQLGVLGRLTRWTPGTEPVHVVPIAAEFPEPRATPRPAGRGVALLGSFNHWFDDERLLHALLAAMELAPLRVVVCGGAVAGHAEAGFARFEAGAKRSAHAARFHFAGWVPHGEIAREIADCTVGVCLDRPGVEPELGSRTRVLYMLHLGLRVIASPRTELVCQLGAAGVVEPDDDLVARLVAERPAPDARAALDRLTVEATMAPLREWARAPVRAAAAAAADPLVASFLARDRAMAELEAVRSSTAWRALDRVNRAVRGR